MASRRMMWRRTTFFVVTVVAVLILVSKICFSLTTDVSNGNTDRVSDAHLWSHQTNSRESIEKTELLAKRQFRRGVGDELNTLKDKAKKASSVYKWLKTNWKKLLIIVVAIFALLVVVGIYRRCFSDSSSGGDDEEPNIVVVKMLKPDNKGKGVVDANAMEGSTQGSDDTGTKGTVVGHGNENIGHTGSTGDLTITDKSRDGNVSVFTSGSVETGGKVYKERSSVLAANSLKEHYVERHVTRVQSAGYHSISDLHEVEFHNFYILTNSIPISGCTTFQQIDCFKMYLCFNQYLIFSIKTMADQLNNQPTRVSQGSTSEGPFPFYEEMPLIKNLMTSLILKHCDDYIPTASTNTNLPLTVSP